MSVILIKAAAPLDANRRTTHHTPATKKSTNPLMSFAPVGIKGRSLETGTLLQDISTTASGTYCSGCDTGVTQSCAMLVGVPQTCSSHSASRLQHSWLKQSQSYVTDCCGLQLLQRAKRACAFELLQSCRTVSFKLLMVPSPVRQQRCQHVCLRCRRLAEDTAVEGQALMQHGCRIVG